MDKIREKHAEGGIWTLKVDHTFGLIRNPSAK